MGSRADRTLKDIDELRAGLERKLGELEDRLPIAGFGRRAAALLAGGTAGSAALGFAARRLLGGRRRRKAPPATAPVVVNVFPRGAMWIAAAGVAVWAGARLYEAYTRANAAPGDDAFRPAVVKPMPEAGRQSGAGS